MKQSLSWKTCFISLLILFFYSIPSELPFCWQSAFSKYCLAVMALSYMSISLRLKSRTTHKKEGNNFYNSSGSQSSRSYDLICNSFDKLMIRLRLLRADSSIVPIELYMKKDESSKASKKILVSWFSSSSNAPIPSLSITIIFKGSS